MARLLRSAGATVVLVTHDQDEALSLGDQVAVMREGRIVQVGDPTDVYTRPCDPEAAVFLGEANLLPGRVEGTTARCALGPLPLATPLASADHSLVLVRPEQCVLTNGVLPQAANATITGSDYHGYDAVTRLILDGHDQPLVARVKGFDIVPPGTRVTVTVTGTVHAWPTPSMPGPTPAGDARAEGVMNDDRAFPMGGRGSVTT